MKQDWHYLNYLIKVDQPAGEASALAGTSRPRLSGTVHTPRVLLRDLEYKVLRIRIFGQIGGILYQGSDPSKIDSSSVSLLYSSATMIF